MRKTTNLKPSKSGIEYDATVFKTEYDMLAWWLYGWMVGEYCCLADVPDVVYDAILELQKTLDREQDNVYGWEYVDERSWEVN